MSSEHLRKYLAYYQKTLREEPENIEARLRLAALFREMGRPAHAVEEYVTASKLLAAQGHPMEAIAACKAVLEIDPTHTEVQFFLARLFAQVPDGAGAVASRIARPLAPIAPAPPRSGPVAEPARPRLQQISPQEAAALAAQGHVITLARPKTAPGLPPLPAPDPAPLATPVPSRAPVHTPRLQDPHATRVQTSPREELSEAAHAALAHTAIGAAPSMTARYADSGADPDELLLEDDALIEALDEPVAELGGEATSPVEDDPAAEDRAPRARVATRAASYSEALMRDAGPLEDLRSTLAMEPEDVLEELRRVELLERGEEHRRTSVSWQPSDRSLHRHFDPAIKPVPQVEETTSPTRARAEERFTLGVFDMDSVELDAVQVDDTRVSALIAEDSAGQLVTQRRLPRIQVSSGVGPQGQRTVSVQPDALPEIPLLSGLGQQGFVELLNAARLLHTSDGQPLLSGQERGRSLFIILRGQVHVSKLVNGHPVQIAAMGEGDFFGEFALLTGRDVPSAQVTSQGQTMLLELTEEMLQRIGAQAPEIWDILWDVYHARMLNNLMASHSIFGKLDPGSRDEIVDMFELREHTAGQIIVSPDEPCPAVFLLLFGEVCLRPQRSGQASLTLREGEFFGFVASLSDDVGRVAVEVMRDTTLLALPAREFRALTRSHPAVAAEIRRLLRDRAPGQDLFMAGITPYADVGFS
jgi:CRP-like cAMP-binding protein